MNLTLISQLLLPSRKRLQKLMAANLLIVPHSLGTPTANIPLYGIIIREYVNKSQVNVHVVYI